ncbi:hypothetical protein F442_22273 [Phytophthora nicotianae P10297]|uniref:Uncharacterized protein n=3 Tax=Phytophthora nicotianae TaxID=4792 RepID=W2Y1C4_PHYNI|nr:hypothetical protein L917_02122 [Phytophthora nicotianae]ETO58602.1 hypothetical protein F444_23018 [Phytophthora nicotianae P1976]ETP28428.1 hypothetical protein F442_22273 [Phytophthora nicotianae P10297]
MKNDPGLHKHKFYCNDNPTGLINQLKRKFEGTGKD